MVIKSWKKLPHGTSSSLRYGLYELFLRGKFPYNFSKIPCDWTIQKCSEKLKRLTLHIAYMHAEPSRIGKKIYQRCIEWKLSTFYSAILRTCHGSQKFDVPLYETLHRIPASRNKISFPSPQKDLTSKLSKMWKSLEGLFRIGAMMNETVVVHVTAFHEFIRIDIRNIVPCAFRSILVCAVFWRKIFFLTHGSLTLCARIIHDAQGRSRTCQSSDET